MYPNMTKHLPFYYDEKGFYQNDKSFMITGKHVGSMQTLEKCRKMAVSPLEKCKKTSILALEKCNYISVAL